MKKISKTSKKKEATEISFEKFVSGLPFKTEHVHEVTSSEMHTLGFFPAPLVFRGAVSHLPALNWTLDELALKVGKNKPIRVYIIPPSGKMYYNNILTKEDGVEDILLPENIDHSPSHEKLLRGERGFPHIFPKHLALEMPIQEAFRRIQKGPVTKEHLLCDNELAYVFNVNIAGTKAEHGFNQAPFGLNCLGFLPLCERLLVGAGGTRTMLHYDMIDVYLAQVKGKKRIVLFPPQASLGECVYPPGPFIRGSFIEDIYTTTITETPELPQLQGYVVELRPGDLLYIPSFVWHDVYNCKGEPNISAQWTSDNGGETPAFEIAEEISLLLDKIRTLRPHVRDAIVKKYFNEQAIHLSHPALQRFMSGKEHQF